MLRPSQKLFRFHWLSLLLMLALAVAGIFFIYSASHTNTFSQPARLQCFYLGAGLVAFFAMSLLDYRILVDYGLWLFGAGLILLVIVILKGHEAYGQQNWLRIGGLSLQPSELAKLGFMCGFTWLLIFRADKIKRLPNLVLLVLFSAIPAGLILLQPDFGSAVVFAPITLVMLYVAGVKKRYILLPVLLAAAGIGLCYKIIYKDNWNGVLTWPLNAQSAPAAETPAKNQAPSAKPSTPAPFTPSTRNPSQPAHASDVKSIVLLKPHQIGRIKTFFDPSLDPQGSGYGVSQSLIAIGTGGVTGKGYLKGDQTVFGFIPETAAHNDYIFSTIADEFGFIGGSIVILTQCLLLCTLVSIAQRAKDLGGSLLVAGIFGMFLTHFFINTGMTYNVVPVIGIPQPFLSYGGTFLVTCMSAMGIAQSVWIHRKDY